MSLPLGSISTIICDHSSFHSKSNLSNFQSKFRPAIWRVITKVFSSSALLGNKHRIIGKAGSSASSSALVRTSISAISDVIIIPFSYIWGLVDSIHCFKHIKNSCFRFNTLKRSFASFINSFNKSIWICSLDSPWAHLAKKSSGFSENLGPKRCLFDFLVCFESVDPGLKDLDSSTTTGWGAAGAGEGISLGLGFWLAIQFYFT